MKDVIIRNAKTDDAAAIADLSNQLGYQSTAAQSEKRLIEVLASRDHAVFLACTQENEVVGWIHAFLAYRIESDCFAEIGGFVVSKSFRNKGLGKSLIAAAEEWTIQKGINKLRVRSQTHRTDALAFYEHLGYSKTKFQQVFDKPLKSKT